MKKSLLFLFIISSLISCKDDDETPVTNPPLQVGDAYQGGIIFYLEATGEHGLIAATADLGAAIWGCIASTSATALDTAIGMGENNTQAIVNNCNEPDIAAKICNNYVQGGFDDWFLPSSDELELMYMHRDLIGGFDESFASTYSSSSEFYPVGTGEYLNNWVHDFGEEQIVSSSRKLNTNKDSPNKIRAVRAF